MFRSFDRTPTCDGRTDRQIQIVDDLSLYRLLYAHRHMIYWVTVFILFLFAAN